MELDLGNEYQARKSRFEAEKALVEHERLTRNMIGAQRSGKARLEVFDMEIKMLSRKLAELRRLSALAAPSTDRDGVLTWVVEREGASVRVGQEIARVADLSAFRIKATIADTHVQSLAWGQPVRINAGKTEIGGMITNIYPTVDNGSVTFEVGLDNPAHAALRHNMGVDVYVITDRRQDAVQLRRGQLFTVDGKDAVYVVRGGVAVQTAVRLGMAGYESYEVLDGLRPGDEVIISDMRKYIKAKEVRLR